MQIACHLPHRGILQVGGADRQAFLQGLVSNDVALCGPDRLLHAALLTPQGKFLHEFFILSANDSFWLETERERLDELKQRLASYKLRAKVAFDIMGDQEVWALPQGGAGLSDPRLAALGTRVYLAKGAANFTQQEAALYDHHRLSLGVADGSRDMIIGKSTLSDGNFDLLNGISWTKGCYVGQELTARMHHRALVKKRLLPLRIRGAAPKPETILYHDGEEIGEMRSSNGDLGLALLSLEKTAPLLAQKTGFTHEGSQFFPYAPGWFSQ